jgi:uncharacterized membrane protein YcaP (DUF421 family)
MFEGIMTEIKTLLGVGLDVSDVDSLQMAVRAAVIYVFSLAIVRAGSKRLLSKASAFDVIVAIMLGSVMSRAINGTAPLLSTLAGGAVLIGLHWLMAQLSFYVHWFGSLIKGDPVLLIEDGRLQHDRLRGAGVSERDLAQALRMAGYEADLSRIRRAYLERDGGISVLPFDAPPRVVNVAVAEGVQTVRIELAE